MNHTRFQFQTDGFHATAKLLLLAHRKSAKFFRHRHPRPLALSLRLKYQASGEGSPEFTAWAIAGQTGPDHVVHASATEPGPALNSAFRKLERCVNDAADERKRRRRLASRETARAS